MTANHGFALTARRRYLGGAGVVLSGPLYDGFSGTGGLSTSRALDGGIGTWSFVRYTGTGETFSITGTGGILTGAGTNPFQGFGFVTKTPSAGSLWSRRSANTLNTIGSASATYVGADHLTCVSLSGAANWILPQFSNITGTGVTSLTAAYCTQAALGGTIASLSNTQQRAGDVLGIRYRTLSTTPELAVYHNGVRMTDWTAINTTTNPITNQMGARGATACAFDDFMVGDPAAERMLDIQCQGRIMQRDPSTGNVLARLVMDATPDVPSSSAVNYTWVDVTARTPISGHNQQPVTSFTSGTGVAAFDSDALKASFVLGSLASPPAAGFFAEVRRTDLSAGVSLGRTPWLYAGDVILMDGQSLTAQGYSATNGLAPVITPTNCWRLNASLETEQRADAFFRSTTVRSATVETNGAINHLFATIQNVNGGLPVQVLQAGFGATLLWERNNSATYATSYRGARNLAIANAGHALRWAVQTGGQYEVDLPNNGGSGYGTGSVGIAAATADWPNQADKWADEIDALLVRPAKFLIVPLTMVMNTADTDTQEFRRMQKKLCDDFPTRFFLGPYSASCNRSFINDAQGDKYHFSKLIVLPALTPDPQVDSGYSCFFRRIGDSIAKHEGWQANNNNGPTLVSATRSGNDIAVTFAPNGGTLELRNTAYLGDFRGGLDFATDTAFTSQIFPTSAAVVGNVVTFTFPPGQVVANMRVRAAYGTHSFSRGLNVMTNHVGGGTSGTTTSIALDPRTRASMVCSNYGGTPNRWIEVQPSLDIGGYGIDYVTAA